MMDHRLSIEVSTNKEAARIEERKLASLRRMSYLNRGFSKLDAVEPNKRLNLCSGAVILGGPSDGSCVPWAHLCSLKNRSDYAAVATLRKRVVIAMGPTGSATSRWCCRARTTVATPKPCLNGSAGAGTWTSPIAVPLNVAGVLFSSPR